MVIASEAALCSEASTTPQRSFPGGEGCRVQGALEWPQPGFLSFCKTKSNAVLEEDVHYSRQ